MNLDVIQPQSTEQPWYSNGLKFTCAQCGNCCSGPPGYVWISDEEIERLATHLKISADEVIEKYCRRTAGGRLSLKERRTREGRYDCIFLKEQVADVSFDGAPPLRRKLCSIYNVRPLQCRTWPFWPENLATPQSWKHSGKRCHGIGAGKRHFSLKLIESMRDAKDWPKNPPTSAPAKR